MNVGLVIPIFNRPLYVKQCFDSLLKLTVKPDVIVLVDDASTDKEVDKLISEFSYHNFRVHTKVNAVNLGVRASLLSGIETVYNEHDCEIVINLDSDAIVKPDFIGRLLELHGRSEINPLIVSGFNCISEANPVVNVRASDYVLKNYCNGINMCFNRKQYEKYIKPNLLKDGNWDYNTSLACKADDLPFIITTPSVVQHIGMVSSMGHTGNPDTAYDFKMLSLPDITLFGIDSHNPTGIQRAADICQKDIEFGSVNIITKDLFTQSGSNEIRRKDYSRFMLKELTKHFTTSHVLTIHADGYILDWSKWDNSWLEYDYIGATWLYKDGKNVGNGGFSLRSKKLCDVLANNPIDETLMHPEDHCICRTYRKSLEDNFGIKFAPSDVADRFSIEAYGAASITGANKYSGQFGFHGVHVDFAGCGLPKEILFGNHIERQYATVEQDRVLRVRKYLKHNNGQGF